MRDNAPLVAHRPPLVARRATPMDIGGPWPARRRSREHGGAPVRARPPVRRAAPFAARRGGGSTRSGERAFAPALPETRRHPAQYVERPGGPSRPCRARWRQGPRRPKEGPAAFISSGLRIGGSARPFRAHRSRERALRWQGGKIVYHAPPQIHRARRPESRARRPQGAAATRRTRGGPSVSVRCLPDAQRLRHPSARPNRPGFRSAPSSRAKNGRRSGSGRRPIRIRRWRGACCEGAGPADGRIRRRVGESKLEEETRE